MKRITSILFLCYAGMTALANTNGIVNINITGPFNGNGGSATNALIEGPAGIYDASLVTNVQGPAVVGALAQTNKLVATNDTTWFDYKGAAHDATNGWTGGSGNATNALISGPSGIYDASLVTNINSKANGLVTNTPAGIAAAGGITNSGPATLSIVTVTNPGSSFSSVITSNNIYITGDYWGAEADVGSVYWEPNGHWYSAWIGGTGDALQFANGISGAQFQFSTNGGGTFTAPQLSGGGSNLTAGTTLAQIPSPSSMISSNQAALIAGATGGSGTDNTKVPTNNGTAWGLTITSGTAPASLITAPPWATNTPAGIAAAGGDTNVPAAYDAAGTGATKAQQATNGLGTAAFQSTSAFDLSGVGATKAQQATNGLSTGAFTTVGNAATGNTNTMKVLAATNADVAANVTGTLTNNTTGNAATSTTAATATSVSNLTLRVFYVGTNGNDGTALINDPTHPFAASFATNTGAFFWASNGDTIYMLDCTNYQATFVHWNSGVTLRGSTASKCVFNATNAVNGPAYSFFQPENNCVLMNTTWYGRPNGGTTFSSWMMAGPISCVNVMALGNVIHGGSDVLYGSSSDGYKEVFLENNYFDATWDLESTAGSGKITGIHNTWIALNSVANAKLNFGTSMIFEDFGSTFGNFKLSGLGLIQGELHLHGSIFTNSETGLFPLTHATIASSGNYVDADNGISYSLDSTLAGYYTALLTTNIANVYSITNIKVLAPSGLGYVTNVYVLNGASVTGDIVNNNANTNTMATWTNINSLVGSFIKLNSPYTIAFEGGPPLLSIGTNGSDANSLLYWRSRMFTVSAGFLTDWQTENFVGNGVDPAPSTQQFTNSIGTNVVSTYKPQSYGGQLKEDTNGTLLLTGNGSGLTNLQASGVSTNGGTTGQVMINGGNGTVLWTNNQSVVAAGAGETAETMTTNPVTGQVTYTSNVNTNQFLASTGNLPLNGNALTNLNLGANGIQPTNPVLTTLGTLNGSALTNLNVSSLVINTNAAPLTNTIVGFFWITNGSSVFKVPVLQ